MLNPSPSDWWGRVAGEAALLRAGDLRRIGELDLMLAGIPGTAAEAGVAPLRQMLAEMTTAEDEQFRELHGTFIRTVDDSAQSSGPAPRAEAPAPSSRAEPRTEARPGAAPAQAGAADRHAARGEEPAGVSGPEDHVDRELFQEFVEESLLHLQSIELNILAMETEPGNLKYVDNIFRPFHTIKGVSGFLNLKAIHEVCHDLESLLDDARRGRLAVAGEVLEVVLEAVDLLQEMIESCRHAERPQDALLPFQERKGAFLERVAQARKASRMAPVAAPALSPAASPAVVPAPAAPAAAGSAPRAPAVTQAAAPAVSQSAAAGVAESARPAAPQGGPLREQAGHSEIPSEGRSEMRAEGAAAEGKPKQGSDGADTVRVRVGLLNQLMNLAGELVLGRNQLLQKLADRAEQVAGLNAILQHVDRVTSEVQEAVMQTRMQPIGGLFSRFHRVTRDLARSLGKQIELSLSGETVELDKSLIEALADPLTHLIRNCADHGIERPEARQASGKPAAGSIALSAHQEGGKVRVVVSDDGAGVNLERVRQKALEKGLITREQLQQMGEREVLQLLFAPGFSTAETVTGVSGRGVGMDVVRQNVERIGGTVEIETRPGEGTTFHLDLPLTLAIIPALIVTAAEQRFAIPQVNLLELVHLESRTAVKDLLRVGETEVYRLRGSMLPLLRLGHVLHLSESGAARTEDVSIAVVAAGEKQFGIVVDRIHDTEEIVVKPLGNLLKHLPIYAGATLMGDGRPALILDMVGLAKTAHLTLLEETSFGARAAAQEDDVDADEQTLLLFTIDGKDQFAVPLTLVSRLEEVPAERIVDSLQGKVMPYRGRLLPLVLLEELTPVAKPPADRETVTVVVFEIEREVGLVVTRIVDAVQSAVQLDTQSLAVKGYAGISLVQDKPTSFVDIYQVIEMAYPQWFQRGQSARRKAIDPERVTILLAEDSSFYRTVEKNYLVQEGFNVLDAADGALALEILREESVDLVITDIEMPNLNGFELTQRIRASREWSDLPVIAVTSLANDADRERGREAGVSAYLVKLQREQLIGEVMRLLSLPERTRAQKVS